MPRTMAEHAAFLAERGAVFEPHTLAARPGSWLLGPGGPARWWAYVD